MLDWIAELLYKLFRQCYFGRHEMYWDTESQKYMDFYKCKRCGYYWGGLENMREKPGARAAIWAEWDRDLAAFIAKNKQERL